jgi:hypothetical protein
MGEFCLLYLLCMLLFPVPQTLYMHGMRRTAFHIH